MSNIFVSHSSHDTPFVTRLASALLSEGLPVRLAITRKTEAAEEVRRLAYELHAKSIALTRRNMRPLLTSSDYLNLEDGSLLPLK